LINVRVLVTGAGGFLGGHLARRLAEAGFDVIAVSRNSQVEPPRSAAAAQRFRTLSVDLARRLSLPDCEAIVHAAATSPWTGSGVDQLLTDNVEATQALARHALSVKASAFIFFSSMSAFGGIRAPVVTETEPPVNPDAYGLTKLLGEKLLQDVADALPSLSIRLPAVIGRGSRRNWPSEALRKLRTNEPLTYFNPQAAFNNAVHERDLAALLAEILARGLAGAELIVVGSTGRTTISEVVELLIEGTQSRSSVTVEKNERPAFLIDSGKAQRLYGFAPMEILTALRLFISDNA
jgi:nucleoside-diphosphate-sugar epimerase